MMHQRFDQLGLTVHTHSVSDGIYSTTNVIAEKKGTQRPNEIVMIGAHYDAFYGGADDNSTGVAAVLEIARILGTRDFPRTIRFVGFDLEEYGLAGSIRYANTEAADDNIVGAIVFDCIGFRSNEPNSQSSLPGFPTPSAGNFLAVIGNGASSKLSDDAWLIQKRLGVVDVIGIDVPGISDSLAAGNLNRSDHTAFWLQGKPALFLTDTANFRNPHYHQPSDEVVTIDPAFLKGVTQLSAALIAYWAGG
jgi:Zn-dependent M28 family amino/carboxypeptidase